MPKRSPEQVHRQGGHDEKTVKSCPLCQGVESPAIPEVRRDVPADRVGPLPEVDPAMYAEDAVPLKAAPVQMVGGRPKCHVEACELPEFMDNVGLCGGHYATRPDLRKVARHG